MNTEQLAFLIPAYNPDANLVTLITSIRKSSNLPIFLINDGSTSNEIFSTIQNKGYSRIIQLSHAINLGKGAAIKTVFNRILTEYREIEGVVVLDSDGQHSVDDCLRVLHEIANNSDAFVLGYRDFTREIPLKSYVGNNISKVIYNLILGYRYKDTQTGLRGVSRAFMKKCLTIKSNRFEFETEQLALAASESDSIIEIPIKTIYIDNNTASSFRPLVDSLKIYFVLFRYALSSIVTACTDFLVFFIAISLGMGVTSSNILARTFSIGVQFTLLNHVVFNTKSSVKSFILFSSYVYLMGILSSVTQVAVVDEFGLSLVFAKISIEGLLFLVNFAFLRSYVFISRRTK